VLVFSSMPAAPSLVRSLLRFAERLAPVATVASGHVFGQPDKSLGSVVSADIAFCDFVQVFTAFRDTPDFLGDRPTVALFAEADLCLYDGRLALFDRGILQAVAAIYRSTGRAAPWREQKNAVDFAELAGSFLQFAGTASYMQPRVAREIAHVYRDAIRGNVRAKAGPRISALAFKTWKEKQDLVCRDVLKAEGDCLVFYSLEPVRVAMQEELRKRGRDSVVIPNPRDLRTFAAMGGSKKRVGFYRGVPTLLTAEPETRAPISVFVCEHCLLEHQHNKIRAFIDRDLQPPQRPYLYFSLEDDMFNVYADEDSFSAAFELIEFTERYDKRRRVRRVMARSILRRIYGLRKAGLNEDFPIFTQVNPQRASIAKAGRRSTKKAIGKRLEGLCFCGSGKAFRECHGKPRKSAGGAG
jgi:hypothetical protein